MVIFGLLGFVLGTVLGSLAKALADRSLANKTFLGRSNCPHCKHTLRPFDLFPILSYLFLKGRCRYCHKKIGSEYWIVEIVTGLIVGGLFYQSALSYQISAVSNTYQIINFIYDLATKTFLAVVLIIITITDLKKTIIPDRITFPAVGIIFVSLAAIIFYRIWYFFHTDPLLQSPIGQYLLTKTDYFYRHAFWQEMIGNGAIADPLTGGLIAALLIGIFFLSLIIFTKGRGMGGGDLKLGILLGLFFGFPLAVLVIVLAFFIGAGVAVFLIIFGKKHFGQTIPFGPFLALSGLIGLFWGPQLLDWYIRLGLH